MKTNYQAAIILIKRRGSVFLAVVLICYVVLIQCKKEVDVTPVPSEPISLSTLNDSTYTIDSLRTWEALLQGWKYSNNGEHKSLLNLVNETRPIVAKLLDYRYDSSLFVIYTQMISGAGWALIQMNQPEEGSRLVRKGSALLTEKLGEYHLRNTENYVAISMSYSAVGDYDHAIEWQKKALRIADKVFSEDHYYFGNLYGNIANIYKSKKDYLSAYEYYKKAYRNRLKTSGIEASLSTGLTMGDMLIETGKTDEAKQLIEEQIQHYKNLRITNKQFETYASLLLAIIALEKKDTVRSSEHISNAAPFLNSIQPSGTPYDFFLLEKAGSYYAKKGAYKFAIQLYKKVAEHYFKIEGATSSDGIQFTNEIGRLYLKMDDFKTALDCFQNSLEKLFGKMPKNDVYSNPPSAGQTVTPLLLEALNYKAKTLLALYRESANSRDLDAAKRGSDLALELIGRHFTTLQWEGSKFTASEQQQNLVETALQIVQELAISENQKAVQALQIIEKQKAVSLKEQVRNNSAFSIAGVPQHFKNLEDSLKFHLTYYQNRVHELENSEKPDSLDLHTCHYKLVQYKESYDSLAKVIEHQYPEYYRLKYHSDIVSFKTVQSLLPNIKTTLLEYFWTDSALYAVFISKQSSQFRFIPLNRDLYKALEYVKQLSPATNFQTFTQTARALYNQLLAPVLPKDHPFDNLIIIPDGPLGNLPFQLLLEKDPDPATLATENWRDLPYLLKSKTIRYEYSAALLLDKQPKHKKETFYVGFAPAFSGQPLASRALDSAVLSRAFPHWRGGNAIPDLKFNRPEVQAVAELIGGTPYLGTAATENNFKQFAPGSSILHLATHACADDQDPLYSQILFAPTPGDSTQDGALHAYELYNMHLNADLAVLSACQTGAGRIQRGEGVMSLSRAFKYAGCPNIVMSLWNANDAASKDIMFGFFKNLKAGQGKAAALSRAQRDYLAKATLAEAHPSRWATFVLIGDDTPVEFGTEKWLVALLTLGLCALIVYLFFGQRKTTPSA